MTRVILGDVYLKYSDHTAAWWNIRGDNLASSEMNIDAVSYLNGLPLDFT